MMECASVGRGLSMGDGDSVSIAAQLEKLQALRASGALSEVEFQKLKATLVAPTPASSNMMGWMIGALAAIAVVIALVLFAMPRHDKPIQAAATPVAQPAAPPAASPPASPLDQSANNPAAEAPSAPEPPVAQAPPTFFQTSFDCTKAGRLALRLICSNPNLAAQDMQLASLYRRARANAVDPSQLSDQQQEWLAARDACANPGCLSAVYAARRRELAQWITN
jgi:uncharacterized protein YecT (DUF1311 family)